MRRARARLQAERYPNVSRWLVILGLCWAGVVGAHLPQPRPLELPLLTVNLPQTATLQYDLNGNLTNDGLRNFAYDADNQLVTNWIANAWKQEFVYDAFGRKRIERTYGWTGSAWSKTNEVRYVYDGMLVIQERNANNEPLVTYTRGLDLSGSRQGAGGIGGMLARTDAGGSAFYHADGAGNITALMYERGDIVARHLYDPFGRQIGQWGPLAEANRYRYSSKELQPHSGLYYFGYRFNDPSLHQWLNQDPIGEAGGINLYRFVRNSALNRIDTDGREDFLLFDLQTDFNSEGFRQGTAEALGIAGPAAAETGASFVPLVGEAMDLMVLGDQASRWWEKALAGTSLGVNAITGGLLPNAGGLLRSGRRLCRVEKITDGPTFPSLKDHAARHSDLHPSAYYSQAVRNIEQGKQFQVRHDGQNKLAYVTRTGPDSFIFTSTSMNKNTIFTHLEVNTRYLNRKGITLPEGF